MELWIAGTLNIFQFSPLLLIIIGVTIGVIFGAIPGMSATMAVALFLPITFGMEPVPSISLLVALFVGGISGGLVTAILINIPGTPSSISSTFDGYPMTQNGEAGRALGLGILYSFIGTLMGCLVLFFIAPPIAKFALKFGSYEYFAIALFALTLVAGLSGDNLAKGLASATLGLMVAMIGVAPIDGYKRFTLGINDLDAGFALVPVLLGLFAVSEMLKEAETSFLEKRNGIPKFEMPGFFGTNWAEIKGQWVNAVRSGAIGIGVGILPGIGAGTSNLLSYLAAKNSSKTPEKFGTGIPDGIIASETANNAGIGAAMIPLVTLGIPGDTVTAMLLGGFLIHGIQPGPLLFANNGALVYSIFVALLVASVVMLCLLYFGVRGFVAMLAIPKHYLLSVVMVMCFVGSFAVNNRMFDVYTLIAFGTLGYVMLKFEYPFPPVILGFILGPMLEQNLRSALMSSKWNIWPFFERPIAAMFLLLAVTYIAIVFCRAIKMRGQ
ncbi:MAG: tripartite tricarboxylate transporter permease [Pseudomonadota bacterium]